MVVGLRGAWFRVDVLRFDALAVVRNCICPSWATLLASCASPYESYGLQRTQLFTYRRTKYKILVPAKNNNVQTKAVGFAGPIRDGFSRGHFIDHEHAQLPYLNHNSTLTTLFNGIG